MLWKKPKGTHVKVPDCNEPNYNGYELGYFHNFPEEMHLKTLCQFGTQQETDDTTE